MLLRLSLCQPWQLVEPEADRLPILSVHNRQERVEANHPSYADKDGNQRYSNPSYTDVSSLGRMNITENMVELPEEFDISASLSVYDGPASLSLCNAPGSVNSHSNLLSQQEKYGSIHSWQGNDSGDQRNAVFTIDSDSESSTAEATVRTCPTGDWEDGSSDDWSTVVSSQTPAETTC